MVNKELTSLEELKEYVKDGYGVVDCYGDFCSACVMLEPIFEGAAGDMAAIRFGRINVSHCGEAASEYGIDAMPTVLFFRNGQEVHRMIGSADRETLNMHLSQMLYQQRGE